MTKKNPNAVALGSMGKGIKKTMTPAKLRQCRDAAKASQQQRAAKKQPK